MSVQPDNQATSPQDDEDRQQLRALLRAHQSRRQVLELQKAKFGDHTPPQVITEIAEIRAEIARLEAQFVRLQPHTERTALRQLRQRALTAYYAQEWERAEELLIQLLTAKPEDQDAQMQLAEAQRQLELRACYQALRDLRDAGNWPAVLVGLDDLGRRQPSYSDVDGLEGQPAADHARRAAISALSASRWARRFATNDRGFAECKFQHSLRVDGLEGTLSPHRGA